MKKTFFCIWLVIIVVCCSSCQISKDKIEDVKEVDIGDTPAVIVEKNNDKIKNNTTSKDTNKSQKDTKEIKKIENKDNEDIKGEIIKKAESDPKVKLIMSEVNPEDSIVGQVDRKFADEVERCSGGSITVDLKAGGTLGAENVVLNKIFGGSSEIDVARISAFSLSEYGCSKSKVLSLPYLFTSREHYWKFTKSDVAKEIIEEPQESGLGVRGLFYGEEGFRHFFSKGKIESISDFKGKKIRVANDPVMTGLVKGLGATPTDIAFTELYSAFEKGDIDGAEQPIVNFKSNSFQKVCPYMILDGHTLGAIEVIMTEIAWRKLTENQQKAINEASKVAMTYNKKLSEEKENETIKELNDENITTITEVSDKNPWKEATKSLIEENTKGYEELYKRIVECQ